MIKHYNIFRLY